MPYSRAPGRRESPCTMGHSAFGLADEYAYYAGGVDRTALIIAPRTGGTQCHDQRRPPDAQVDVGGQHHDRPADHGNPDCASADSRRKPGPAAAPAVCCWGALLTIAARIDRNTTARCGAWACPSARSASTPSRRASRRSIVSSACRLGRSYAAAVGHESRRRGRRSPDGRSTTAASPMSVLVGRLPARRADGSGLVFLGTAVMIAGARPDVVAAFRIPRRGERRLGLHGAEQHAPAGTERHLHAARRRDVSRLRKPRLSGRGSSPPPTPPASSRSGPSTRRSGRDRLCLVTTFGWGLHPAAEANSRSMARRSTSISTARWPAISRTTISGQTSRGCLPGYANSNGAVGFFQFDSRDLSNGLHMISWVVRDDAGATQGVGSRYFTVRN